MVQLFNTFLYQPLLNLLVFLYNIVPGHDLGIAIIILTILIKVVLYPLSHQAIKSQKALQDLQPKIADIKKQYADNKEKQAREMMELYKREKINPLSSCLPLLIQLPFLIAVFQVFQNGLKPEHFQLLYPFVQNPGSFNSISFWFLDLTKPNIVLAVLTGLAQFWQTKMLSTTPPPRKMPGAKDEDFTAMMNKQMLYFMPFITIIIGVSLPAGLVLYWLVMTLLTVGQQAIAFRKKPQAIEVIK